MKSLLAQLESTLDRAAILTGDAVQDRYLSDWTGENPCRPQVVLRPRSTAEVSTILGMCNDYRQPVVAQGGLTGLAGGGTPRAGEWSLSLERMNGIVELDSDSMTITVKAGTPLEKVQDAAAAAGFMLPLDLGARGSCTIGGNVSTNAGGNQVIQYGMTRSLVLGLDAVLADGTIISSHNKLLKNNSGFDLKHLFIGSEGTLGVVTEVILRLFPATSSMHSALCGLSDFTDVIAFLKSMKQKLPTINSFELMWKDYYRAAIDNVDYTRDPLESDHEYYVLIESEGKDPQLDSERFESALFSEMESGRIRDAVLAKTEEDRDGFWAIRDAISHLLKSYKHFANFDVGIPLNETGACIDTIRKKLTERFDAPVLLIFGHVGDGNLHLVVDTGKDEDKKTVYDMVYQIVGEHNGCISAEHGIGMLKKTWLQFSRSQAEIDLMKKLKQSLDPNNILNPGRIF